MKEKIASSLSIIPCITSLEILPSAIPIWFVEGRYSTCSSSRISSSKIEETVA